MAKCVRCQKETELYDAGVPICLACIRELEKLGPAKHHEWTTPARPAKKHPKPEHE